MAQVECRSSASYAERPVAVWWQGQRLEVEAVEQEWRTPTGKNFRVRLSNGTLLELDYTQATDEWQITPQ